MKYIISRYNHDTSWIDKYTNDFVIYDRSEIPIEGAIIVPNIGSDIYDKLTYIIDNYDNLPDVAVYTKCNLFKYITKTEWDKICNNTTFTPIIGGFHKDTTIDHDAKNAQMIPEIENNLPDQKTKDLFHRFNMTHKTGIQPFSYYKDGLYYELNVPAYLSARPTKNYTVIEELMKLLGIWDMEYIPFAPGSGYILTRENILQNSKDFYIKLRSYLDWAVYPGECFIIERGLYNIFKPR